MRQLPLPLTPAEEHGDLAGTMPTLRAAMRRAAEGEGRKALPERMNAVAKYHQISLGGGAGKAISEDMLQKWMSPSDESRPASILGCIVFCRVTQDTRPLLVVLLALGRALAVQLVMEAARALGLEILSDEDRRFRDIGKASVELKAARKRMKRLEEGL